MNLLLDTHVALWAITDSPMLADKARALILSPKTTVWVSVASVWEIAIKHSLGGGAMPVRPGRIALLPGCRLPHAGHRARTCRGS